LGEKVNWIALCTGKKVLFAYNICSVAACPPQVVMLRKIGNLTQVRLPCLFNLRIFPPGIRHSKPYNETIDNVHAYPLTWYVWTFWDHLSQEEALIAIVVFLVLLLFSMAFDLKSRQVPNALTLTALIGAGCFAIYRGDWAVVVLTIALIFLSDLRFRKVQLALAFILAGAAFAVQPATGWLCVAETGVWLSWLFGKMGGADVKLILSSLLFAAQPAILLPIFFLGGVQGLLALLRKQKEIAFVVSIFAGSLWYFVGSIY
jgi:Flp pilus assembly protein protease CpaA